MASATVDFGELVQRGYRFALSLTHDESRAEDLVQDAWFSVFKAKGPWNAGYLFAAIRNKFIDHCRRERIAWAESLDHAAEIDSADSAGDVDGFADIALANGRFESALKNLRAEERAVLFLMLVEGFTAQAIADLFEWPRGTVLSMAHRARQKVRDSVNGESVEKR